MKQSRNPSEQYYRVENTDTVSILPVLLAAVIVGIACIGFLWLKSSLNHTKEEVEALRTQVTQATEANDVRYYHLEDSIDLDKIRERALSLGMSYAGEDQIVTYEEPAADYVEQKHAIPD